MRRLVRLLPILVLFISTGAFADAWSPDPPCSSRLTPGTPECAYTFGTGENGASATVINGCSSLAIGFDPATGGAGTIEACKDASCATPFTVATLGASMFPGPYVAPHPLLRINRTAPSSGTASVFVRCEENIALGEVPLGTRTSGNYAAGDAEAGAALTGDSATAFFSAGTLEDIRVDGSLESDEVTGLADGQISDTLTASTSTTAAANDNDTSIATTAFVQQEIDDGDLLTDNCILENDSTPIPDSCVGNGTDDLGAGGGDAITVEDGDNGGTSTAMTDALFEDSGDLNFVRTAGTPDEISAQIRAGAVGTTEAAALDAGDTTTGSFPDARLDNNITVDEPGIAAAIARDTETCGGGACAVGTDDTVTLAQGVAPAPTVEGRLEWETDDDHLIGGDGVAQVEFVPAEDVSGDATMDDAGVVAVADDSHAHTSTTISGIDISADTNLAATAPVSLSGDTVTTSMATDRLLGRDTAATGVAEEIALDDSLEFTGSVSIQRAALTGDVTAAAGGNATTVANVPSGATVSIDETEIQLGASDRLVGRDTAAAGAAEEIALNATLEFDGSLNLRRAALTGPITAAAGSNATDLAASVAGRSITETSDVLDIDAELYTGSCDFAVEAPVAADDGDLQCYFPNAATLTRLYCSTDTGTSVINLYERAESTPNTGTTDMVTTDLTCDTDGQATTTFTDSAIAADALLALGLQTTFTTGWVRAHAEFTVND